MSLNHPPTPEQIREARTSLGLTQEQAASIVKVSRRSWQNWEADKGSPEHRQMSVAVWELFYLKTAPMRDRHDNGR